MTVVKIQFFCILTTLNLLLAVSVQAGEALFTLSSTSRTSVYHAKMLADNSQRKIITLNNTLLSSKKGDELDFVSMSGTPYTLIFDKIKNGYQSKTWIAHLKNHGIQYRAIITLNKDQVEGRISTPEGTMHLKSTQGEIQLIDYQAEGAEKVPFANDIVSAEDDIPLSEYKQGSYAKQSDISLAATPSFSNGNTIVDVLVLYNQSFSNENGADPAARIDHLTALANQAYSDSQVAMQIRVVAMKLIDYSNSSNNSAALSAISGTSALAKNVAAMRDLYGADLVTFIRPYDKVKHGSCGLAQLNSSIGKNNTYAATRIFSTVSDGIDLSWSGSGPFYRCMNDVYAHELGHTMGLTHDRMQPGVKSEGSHSYSYGYGIKSTFGTIMSYLSPDVYVFSNPNIQICQGHYCGTANDDNARSLTLDKNHISAFRNEAVAGSSSTKLNSVYYMLLQ